MNKIKYILVVLIILFNHIDLLSQIHFTGSAKMIIQGSSKVTIDNPISNGITWTTDNSGILTESENSKVIMNVGNNTGTYRLPFLTPSGNTIPFTYDITVAGSGNGQLVLSSWGTNDDNSLNLLTGGPGLPFSVDQFFTENTFGNWTNLGGLKVINRFWSIDPIGYSIKPKGEYIFTYHLSEKPAPLLETQLTAQRWNDIDHTWLDWLYASTADISNKTVSVYIFNPEDQYMIWTLSDISDPLPIEMVRFTGNCSGDDLATLKWTTWTETNNEMFIIEHSIDGYQWSISGIMNGSGNSNIPINYELDVSINSETTNYFRIIDVDTWGNYGTSRIMSLHCEEDEEITVYPVPTYDNLTIFGIEDPISNLYDSLGKLIGEYNSNRIDMNELSSGNYLLKVFNNKGGYKNFKIIKK